MRKNLMDLELNTVSERLSDYSMMITAESGFGKTPFLAELFGDRALFLSFEQSTKGIAGIYSVDIDSYETLVFYVNQLENPKMREKFDVIIVETLFLMDYMCEQSVCDSYGKDLLSDCLNYNKGYKILDKKFISLIKRIQKMGYGICYVSHPVEKKVQIGGQDIVRYEPKVSDRIATHLLPEIDVKLFCTYDQNGNKVIYTQSTPYFSARCRVGHMEAVIPFSAEVLKDEFAKGIQRKYKQGETVEKLEHHQEVEETIADVMKEIGALGQELTEKGLAVEANVIVNKELGTDDVGNQRTLNGTITLEMLPALKVIRTSLKALNDKK